MRHKTNRRDAIEQALQRDFGGNLTEMANACGVARMTLFRHLRGHGKNQSRYISEDVWERLEPWAGRYDRARRVPVELEAIVAQWQKLSDADKSAISGICRAIAAKYTRPGGP